MFSNLTTKASNKNSSNFSFDIPNKTITPNSVKNSRNFRSQVNAEGTNKIKSRNFSRLSDINAVNTSSELKTTTATTEENVD